MTSSTIVFSASGVSAATTCPTMETPNAIATLRLCAMRNGNRRPSHPPASGDAGSGVGRSAARKVMFLHHPTERLERGDPRGALALSLTRGQDGVELRGHR